MVAPATSLVEEVILEKLRTKVLRRRHAIRSTLWCKVHQVPVRPDRVDMIALQFCRPEMEDVTIDFAKYVQGRPLHIVVLALALVVLLISGAIARQ